MKKILSLALVAVMMLSLFAFTSCGETPAPEAEKLNFGFGVVYSATGTSATPAEGDISAKNGKVELLSTAAAVLLDKDGKIVKCVIDTMQIQGAFTVTGEAIAIEGEQLTKYEKGNAYGMSANGKTEWFLQIDALCNSFVGKTIDEVKAMMVNGMGNDEIISAGCTIYITDYVAAIEKAVANASASSATADSTLKLAMVAEVTSKNYNPEATKGKEGSQAADITIFANALDAEGKIVAAYIDCTQNKVTFDAEGQVVAKTATSKDELGDDYGMVAFGGAAKEWYEQVDAFTPMFIGKNASEIAAFVLDTGYGSADVVAAGCTIAVDAMVKAAVKAATIAD